MVYVPPEKQKDGKNVAPLQSAIGKVLTDLETWLAENPETES